MSDFYRLRRIAITDATAFAAFLIGFFGSMFFSVPGISIQPDTRDIARGITEFAVISIGTAIIAGLLGLMLGHRLGAMWEWRHKRRRLMRQVLGLKRVR